MRQDLGVQTDRNTLHALRQQQRELNRQMDRLVLTAVVTLHPFRGLGVKYCLQGKLTQPRLDVTRSGGSITRQNISPVSLAVNEQIFLAQLHQRVTNRRIAVRVVLHRLTDDVRHLVVLAVIYRLHRMQYTTLYRLESILYRRYSTL